MIDRLREGDLSAGELAEPLPISRSAVSQHLKVLEDAGLITRSKNAQRRIVHLNTERLSAATDWLLAAREDWEQRFDTLDQVLAETSQPKLRPQTNRLRADNNDRLNEENHHEQE